jgi:predicted permease
LNRTVWDAVERLVYYVLFPVLLFNSILKSPLQPGQTLALAAGSVGTVACGIALAFALGRWPGIDPRLHASGAQTAFRFNSFIALALAERLGGQTGLAWMALSIALCVPLCNVAAVWPLARHGGHSYGRELLRNPLILSTLAGLLANAAG